MSKFIIIFEHTAKMTYRIEIEADNKTEAIIKFNEDPFQFVEDLNEVESEEGVDNEIIEIKEI